ncbi:unnamed protein product [Caenorhabditis angaria]|uniref:PAN-3 domain-containing protein n=1 Tax=Caenorhabditis angaria TaxID=860376 RepID=A0A9P1ITX7_9PELO|nr:unnamed protein product [Caenorhabditis angaria]
MQSWTTEGEDEDEEDTCISFCDQYSTCVLAHFDRPTSTCNTCLAPVIAQKLDNSQSKKIALKIDSVQSCAENPYRNYSITLSNKNYGIIYDDKAGIWNITEKECVTMECVANKLKRFDYGAWMVLCGKPAILR